MDPDPWTEGANRNQTFKSNIQQRASLGTELPCSTMCGKTLLQERKGIREMLAMMGFPQQWGRGQNTRAGLWGHSHRAGGGSATRPSSSAVRTNLRLGLNKKPFLPLPPSPFPPLSPQPPRLLLLLPPDGQPAQPGPVRAVPGVSEPGTSRLLHGRNSTYAPPRRASCLRLHSNPGDTCSGPSQVPGPAPPAPGPLRPSESPQGSEHLRCQGKASADGGASSAARPAHHKCSEFLAGQNGG